MRIKNIPKYDGAGIYMIKGTNNDLVYVGSSVNIHKRLLEHERAISTKGGSTNRMRSMIKSEYQFDAAILEKVSGNHTKYYLHSREDYYIKKFNACGENGLNSIPASGHKNSTSALSKDLKCLISSINILNKRMNNIDSNKKYTEDLILSADKCTRIILESMLQNMQYIKN